MYKAESITITVKGIDALVHNSSVAYPGNRGKQLAWFC